MNISRKHKLHLYTICNHHNFRLGLNGVFGRSEELYVKAEQTARCRKLHREFRKEIKKGGIL